MFELFTFLFAIFGSMYIICLIILESAVALVVFILAILELRKAIAKILDKYNKRRK